MRERALSISIRVEREMIDGGAGPPWTSQARIEQKGNVQRPTLNVQRSMKREDIGISSLASFLHQPLELDWMLNVERWTFPFLPSFPSCVPQATALTLRRVMRLLLRRACLTAAAGLSIFCCSCERHRVEEQMPAEHQTKSGETDAANPHAAATPEARSSPANFFPDKPKP